MSKIIEDTFKKTSDNNYRVVYRQLAFAIMGALGFGFILWVSIPVLIETFQDGFIGSGIFLSIVTIFFYGMFLAFIPMGLYATITEIDLGKRKIRLMKKTIFGGGSIFETDIDKIGISAARIGITDASPNEVWIAKAGFTVVTESGGNNDFVIWSKEVTSVTERNNIMFELYRFFFPDRSEPKEEDLITNGNILMLLSDEQKKAFENGTLFDIEPIASQNINNKFDNLFR